MATSVHTFSNGNAEIFISLNSASPWTISQISINGNSYTSSMSSVPTSDATIKKDIKLLKYCYINSFRFDRIFKIDYTASPTNYIWNGISFPGGTIRIYINPNCPYEIPSGAAISLTNGSTTTSYNFDYYPIQFFPDNSGTYRKPAQDLCSKNVSYSLLRTNPKLTGNIKVVVENEKDSSGVHNATQDIYLDTFKVSSELSKKKYRKQRVSPYDKYASNVQRIFSDMPSRELYYVDSACYDMFGVKGDYKDQYYSAYEYGVRTNGDRLYSENLSFLAPLCVKNVLPDFFLVFRVDGPVDVSIYSDVSVGSGNAETRVRSITDSSLFQKYLETGTLVESFDMRKHTALGRYLRGILSDSKDTVGDIYIPFDKKTDTIFNGISVNKGIVTKIHESPFSLIPYTGNQTLTDSYYTEGFERHHILKDNLINFEFMFDDTDASIENFTINRYFGLYVKINEQDKTYYCISGDTSDGYTIIDSSWNEVSQSDGTFIDPTKERRLIYCIDSPTECGRLTSSRIESDAVFEKYTNNPYKNILRCDIGQMELKNDAVDSFMTITLNYPLNPGDTIRVVDASNLTVYEAIASNDASLRTWYANDTSYMIGNCITRFEDVSYYVYDETAGTSTLDKCHWTIKSVPFFCPYDNVSDTSIKIDAQISEETERIAQAFVKMDSSTMGIYSYDSSSIAFFGTEGLADSSSSLWIERISSTTLNSFVDKYSYDDNVVLTVFQDIQLPSNTFSTTSTIASKLETGFVPHGFEILGNRTYYAAKFMEVDASTMFSISKPSASVIDPLTLCLVKSEYANGTSYNYRLLNYFDFTCYYDGKEISSLSANGKSLMSISQPNIIPSFLNPQNYIISAPLRTDSSKDSLSINNGKINFYSVYPLKVGLAGIFPVRDLNLYINDTSTSIFNEGNTAAADQGIWSNGIAYKSLNPKTRNGEFEYFRNYLRLSDASTYSAFTASDISTYYDGGYKADTPILSPTICKWTNYSSTIYPYQYYATYNNNFAAFADGSSSISFESYGIAGDSSVIYYFYDDSGFDITNYTVGKDSSLIQMREKLIVDGDVGTIASKNSSVYSVAYSMGTNRLDIMAYGTKIEISSLDVNKINVSEFNGYSVEIYPINSINPKYDSPIEIMVNKQTENILIGWYVGRSVDKRDAIDASAGYPNRILMTSGTMDSSTIAKDASELSIKNIDVSVGDVSLMFFSGVNINNLDSYSRYNDFTTWLNGTTIADRRAKSGIISVSIDNSINISTGDISDGDIFRLPEYYKTYLFISSSTGTKNSEKYYTVTDDEFFNSLSHLKNSANLPMSIYIKNGTSTVHYLSSDILSISMPDPIYLDSSLVQERTAVTDSSTKVTTYTWNRMKQYPTVFEPDAVDILRFSNSPSNAYITDGAVDPDNSTGFSYFNANVWVEGVNPIQQLWYRKTVDASNMDFCKPASGPYRFGFDVRKNYSPMTSPWDASFNRKYDADGTMRMIPGYKNCCETPSFFSSRGLMMKDSSSNGRTFYITKWIGVFEEQTSNYYKEDQDVINKKLIKIDINRNVLNTFLSNRGIIYNWIYIPTDDIDDNTKSEYVKNTIMPLYTINNKAKFTFYRMKNINGLATNFVDYSTSYLLDRRYEFTEITNIDSEITYESNDYFINIYVPATNDYLYTATYKMELRDTTES